MEELSGSGRVLDALEGFPGELEAVHYEGNAGASPGVGGTAGPCSHSPAVTMVSLLAPGGLFEAETTRVAVRPGVKLRR